MKNKKAIRAIFYLSAAYDAVLGLAFLICPDCIYHWFGTPPPNHMGYVQFPAALLLIFSWMFLKIARRPRKHANLIPFGIALKISYCAVTGYYWATGELPAMWRPFTICDLFMGASYAWAYCKLKKCGDDSGACGTHQHDEPM